MLGLREGGNRGKCSTSVTISAHHNVMIEGKDMIRLKGKICYVLGYRSIGIYEIRMQHSRVTNDTLRGH